jgi:uncharacterized protein HemX
MTRTVVAVSGTCVALILAVLLAVQVPAASSLGARKARGDVLHGELVILTDRTSATSSTNASTQQRLAATTAASKRLHRRVKREGRTVAALKKQVGSLQKDVRALGG